LILTPEIYIISVDQFVVSVVPNSQLYHLFELDLRTVMEVYLIAALAEVQHFEAVTLDLFYNVLVSEGLVQFRTGKIILFL